MLGNSEGTFMRDEALALTLKIWPRATFQFQVVFLTTNPLPMLINVKKPKERIHEKIPHPCLNL